MGSSMQRSKCVLFSFLLHTSSLASAGYDRRDHASCCDPVLHSDLGFLDWCTLLHIPTLVHSLVQPYSRLWLPLGGFFFSCHIIATLLILTPCAFIHYPILPLKHKPSQTTSATSLTTSNGLPLTQHSPHASHPHPYSSSPPKQVETSNTTRTSHVHTPNTPHLYRQACRYSYIHSISTVSFD